MASKQNMDYRDRMPITPVKIAVRLILLQALILRTTSGHGQGGTHRAYLLRSQLRRDLDWRDLFHWHILRGVTAIGIGNADWLPEIRDLITDLCAADGIRCLIDPTHAEADELIDAEDVLLTPNRIAQLDSAGYGPTRAASALAPTVNLARSDTSPIVVFTPAWADYFGSKVGSHRNNGFLELVVRFKLSAFRVVILCHDSYAFADQFSGIVDFQLQPRGMGDWVFRKLCTALCGHANYRPLAERGVFFSAATPAVLSTAWKPGMSPEVFRLMILETSPQKRNHRD